MAAQEALERLVEKEAGEERAGAREHHQKAGEPGALADGDGAEGGPVDLCLLAGEHREAEERLVGARFGPCERSGEAERPSPRSHDHGASEAAVLHAGEDAARASRGRSRYTDRAWWRPGRKATRKPTRLDGERDGVVVKAQLGGDGADLPVLGEEESPDAGALAPRRSSCHLLDEEPAQVLEVTHAGNVTATAAAERGAGSHSSVYRGPPRSMNVSRKRLVSDAPSRSAAHSAARTWRPCQSAIASSSVAIARGWDGGRDNLAFKIVSWAPPSRSPSCGVGPARCPSIDCSSVVSSRAATDSSMEIPAERSETVAVRATSRRPVSVTICRRAARRRRIRPAVAQRPSKLFQCRRLDARRATERCRSRHSGEQ